jgi:mannose-6-phosphate isomerase-like protein (cupin superfamily)
MSDPIEFPYDTRLDIAFGPLEPFDVRDIANKVTHPWFNQTLCQVNDSVVRVGIVQGEYHWHKHEKDDEFFYVVEGTFIIDLEGRSIGLVAGQGVMVPRGVLHRTRAPERAIVLMVETRAIVPKGG